MHLWLAFILGLFTLHGVAAAQSTPKVYHADRATTDPGNTLIIGNYATAGVKIAGSGTFEVTFQILSYNTQTWDDLKCKNVTDGTESTTADAAGSWQCPVAGFGEFRVNLTTCSGCSVTATGYGTQAASRSSGGSGSGTVTSVDASGGVETVSGSAITSTGTIRGTLCVKHVTTTTYTVLTGDRACMVVFANADPIAVTLPEAGTTGFEDKWFFQPVNDGAGTVTITPTTSTIQGDADLDLTTGKGVTIASDGTNYVHNPGLGLTAEVQGLAEVFAIGKVAYGANSSVNALGVGKDANDHWLLYHDATDGLQFVGVCGGVINDCDYIRKLASGKKWEVTNSSDTAIFTLTESIGALTNVTLDGEGSGNTITLTEEAWFDVAACQNATAQLVWDEPTSNAPAAACDTGTNTQKGYASFDATTDESFQMNWVLPTGFTGNIDIHFIWKAAATTGAVGWCAQLIRVADASTSDPAYPAQAAGNCVSDTAKGTTLQENHATISGVTCTSCAARDHVYVRISRDANGGAVTDDMAGDAHLMKVGRTWRVAH